MTKAIKKTAYLKQENGDSIKVRIIKVGPTHSEVQDLIFDVIHIVPNNQLVKGE